MSHQRTIIVLTALMTAGLAAVSGFGAFDAATYARDAPSMAAQGAGQDLVDLVLVVPLLVVSLILMLRGSRIALFVFGGGVFYVLYSFFIYSFGVHFNRFFLVYCLILGTALYAFILVVLEAVRMPLEAWVGEKAPVRSVGTFLLAVSALFSLLWLKDAVPAVLGNTVPPSVADYGLLVNPVHVLDLAIALPGLVVAAVLLMRRRRLGFLLAPVALVFLVILAVALAAMVAMTKARGISEDATVAAVFIGIAVISTVSLGLFLKNVGSRAKM
jgi:hypothetical protein